MFVIKPSRLFYFLKAFKLHPISPDQTKSMLPVVSKSEKKKKRPSEKQIKQHNRKSTFKHFFFPVAQIVNVNKVYYSKRFLFSSCWWILIHWIVYLRLSFIYIAADVACCFLFILFYNRLLACVL